jgi:hypothetical protein
MSEEVEKRAGALTHEISSNNPTQFDISARRHRGLTQNKTRHAQRSLFNKIESKIFEHACLIDAPNCSYQGGQYVASVIA